MKRCIHLKTGKIYHLVGSTSIKVPIINLWIEFIKYQDLETLSCYYRFKKDFATNFGIKE